MEAMASGVPVVASRLSGIPELVKDGVSGLLVAPGDADGLASAVARLHDDAALRRRLAERGRQVVLDGFDIRASAARLAAAIDAAAQGRAPEAAAAALPAATGARR
jgi:glycosyltransferase involved in cell wall biosynthesis